MFFYSLTFTSHTRIVFPSSKIHCCLLSPFLNCLVVVPLDPFSTKNRFSNTPKKKTALHLLSQLNVSGIRLSCERKQKNLEGFVDLNFTKVADKKTLTMSMFCQSCHQKESRFFLLPAKSTSLYQGIQNHKQVFMMILFLLPSEMMNQTVQKRTQMKPTKTLPFSVSIEFNNKVDFSLPINSFFSISVPDVRNFLRGTSGSAP